MFDSAHYLIWHSYFRWVVLLIMVIQFIWIFVNHKRNKLFTKKDYCLLVFFTTIYNIQLILGWTLYLNSLIVENFWQNITVGIKNRQERFFGLEHMTMMNLGILLANIYMYKSYKFINKEHSFTKLLKSYIWIYLIILSSVPWSFSPLTSRPDFR